MRPLLRPALLVFLAALAARLTAQPANVQADPTTGALFRPSAATFISGNNLASATGGIVLGANGGTGVANTGKTLTLGGNVTTSGAFGLTLTLTAATGVTLPTTGTLATLAGSETLTNKTLTSPTLTTPTLGAATATSLTLSGNISSSAWTTSGVRLKGVAATLTDTTSTGTVTAAYTDVLGGNTIAASSATTYTDYITAYFREPTAGSLVTMTNKWALGGESLRIGTSTPMSVSTAGAITANSLTGRASTDLTLTGGSTGASLVLGQGTTAANATILPKGTGSIGLATSSATLYGKVAVALATATSPATVNVSGFDGTYVTFGGVTNSGYSTFGIGVTAAGTTGTNLISAAPGNDWLDINYYGLGHKFYSFGAEKSRFTSTGNLLIGTTTDMTGVAGGVKIAATNASLNSTSGALQVAGGIYAGENSVFAGDRLLARKDQNAVSRLQVRNDTSGTSAQSQVSATLGDFTTYTAMGSLSAGFTTSGLFAANAGYIASNAAAGLNLFTVGATSLTLGTNSMAALTLASTQAATFAGAVTIAGTVIHTLSATPASASATGTVGTMSWDANYIYICTATNTWKRVAIATW